MFSHFVLVCQLLDVSYGLQLCFVFCMFVCLLLLNLGLFCIYNNVIYINPNKTQNMRVCKLHQRKKKFKCSLCKTLSELLIKD